MGYQVQANRFGECALLEPEAAYIAGLFDGEGSLYLVARKAEGRRSHHFHPEMTVGNRSLAVLEWLVDRTGNGAIYVSHAPRANHQQVYRWQLQPSQMRLILPQVLPYLFIKKPQADLLLEFFDLQRQADRGPWGNARPEVIDRILDIYHELRALNLRGLTLDDQLEFSVREAVERPDRVCSVEGCTDRCYRAQEQCYKHWLHHREPVLKTCEECGKQMDAIMPHRRFCSKLCRNRNSYERRKAAAAPKEEAEN